MTEFLSLKDAISKHIHNGMTVSLEGFTHLTPYAAGHEIIRQNIRDLTVIRMNLDLIHEQMIGMGIVKKMIFSYGGNAGVGLLRRFRDCIENGIPHKIIIEERSHSDMAHSYRAGAEKMPFAVFRGYIGAELKDRSEYIKTITCPFTGEDFTAVPSIQPDVSVIHAQKADKHGNILLEGIVGVQKEVALCAKHCIITVEEIVDDFNTHKNACIIPHFAIGTICVVPGGASPSYASGYYDRDNALYIEWDEISKTHESFMKWMDKNVLQVDETIFDQRVERLR